MQVKIDRKLNLVIPVDRDEGEIYVHSTPIGKEVFERYFMVISKTFSAIYSEGLNSIAGPRVAAMMLKRIASDIGIWEDVKQGLVAEIHRLSMVIAPGDKGWTTLPLHIGISQGLISEEEADEVEGQLVFFIVISAMHKRRELMDILDGGLARLWRTQTTFLSSTEFASSLQTSTIEESTGGKVKQSSIPS